MRPAAGQTRAEHEDEDAPKQAMTKSLAEVTCIIINIIIIIFDLSNR
jgi:hypothetical protein